MEEPTFNSWKWAQFVACLGFSLAALAMRSPHTTAVEDFLCIVPAAAIAGAAIGTLWKREVECALTFAVGVAFLMLINSPFGR
jgi:hypothetical protein